MRNLIVIDIKGNHLIDSQGRSQAIDSLENALDFCMINQPDTFVCVWNLYELIEKIREFMPDEDYQKLLETDKCWTGQPGNRYKLFCSQGKRLCIGHEFKERDRGNFYNTTKVETDIFNLYKYFPGYKPVDIQDIHNKGLELLKTLDDMGMGDTPTLASGIAIYKATVLDKAEIPTFYECPEQMIDMAEYLLPLMAREWRACYQIGHWPEAWDVDVHSAYPGLVANFGDLRDCKIWYGKHYQDCDFGVFKGKVTITGDTPIVNQDKIPVIGTYEDYLTSDQWAYLNKYKKGQFECIDGWMLKFNSDYKPFKELMTNLFNQRKQGGLVSDITKSIMVGLIGQFAQTYTHKHGDFFNPAYSVLATSRCSLKVARKIEELNLWDSLINVVVDGFLCDKPVEITDTGELGSWHSEKVNALVLSLGHSYVADKHPGNVYYADMVKAIKKNPKLRAYNDMILSQEMNTSNRIFEDYPQNGKDLLTKVYKSKPLKV